MSADKTKKHNTGSWGTSLGSWIISALVALPMLVVVFSLFRPDDGSWQHLVENTLFTYVSNTGLLMLLVFAFSATIGITTAWLVSATDFPGRKVLSWALVLPLAAPAYIIAYVYTDLLDYAGPVQSILRDMTGWGAGDYWFPRIRTLPGAALMLSLVLYPYIYLFARTAFQQRSATLFEAARSLGNSPLKAFWRVALPAARPAIAGGAALVMMETLADYGVVDFFGVPTFSTGIFRTWFALGERLAALKLAAVMFIVVATLVALERFSRRGMVSTSNVKDHANQLMKLSPLHGAMAFIACLLPVLLGAIIPILTLLQLHVKVGDPKFGSDFISYISNSVSAAAIAAIIATALAILLNYAQRLNNNPINRYAVQISTLGYALPGTMIAVGLLAPLTSIDKDVSRFLGSTFDIQTGLILTGTITALVYAYVIRFLTVAYNSVHGGLETIHSSLDQAARSLGASPLGVLGRIHMPLMRNSVIAAILLVFVDVMRELPATLILRPFNFETLATRVYRLASDERIAEASTASLTIIIIGFVPVLLVNLLAHKSTSR